MVASKSLTLSFVVLFQSIVPGFTKAKSDAGGNLKDGNFSSPLFVNTANPIKIMALLFDKNVTIFAVAARAVVADVTGSSTCNADSSAYRWTLQLAATLLLCYS